MLKKLIITLCFPLVGPVFSMEQGETACKKISSEEFEGSWNREEGKKATETQSTFKFSESKLFQIQSAYQMALAITSDERFWEGLHFERFETYPMAAYRCFKLAADYGHVSSAYHLGWLHEIAASYGCRLMFEEALSPKEHLEKASYFYTQACVYNLPRCNGALSRVIQMMKDLDG